MLDFTRKLEDILFLDDQEYRLNLTFDNILKLSEMFSDEAIPNVWKPHFALKMLTGTDFSDKYTIEEALNIYKQIFDEHIYIKTADDDIVEYDLAGNPLPKEKSQSEERLYSIKYDSDYIFAGFMQTYNIDLFEVQGKLHWKKFNALLSGLPEGTRFIEITKIRSWNPQKGDSSEYKEHMRKLQEQYRLPD